MALAILVFALPALGARFQDAKEADSIPEYKLYSAESEAGKEKMMEGLGCYCKKVASVSECPLYKEDKDLTDPNRDRWFHSAVTGNEKPHLCCKLAQNGWYNRVGRGYERQAHFHLCTFEVRPLPSNACCRVGADQTVNVHIKQAALEGHQVISQFHWKPKEFVKTHPAFEMSDVTGATDYDGHPISAEDTQQFLKMMAKSLLGDYNMGEKLTCDRSFEGVLKDTDECHLRENPTECCCTQDSLRKVETCLEVSATSAKADQGPLVITGTYHEEDEHGHRKGTITWPPKPTENDKDLMPLLEFPDPETGNTDLLWAVDYQWNVRCLRKQRVARVKKKLHMERVFKHYSREKQIWNTYHQEYRRKCISWEYTRKCPPGQAFYAQQFSKGTCVKDPGHALGHLQLTDLGNWSFECPAGYQSGKKGTAKFNSRCQCDSC